MRGFKGGRSRTMCNRCSTSGLALARISPMREAMPVCELVGIEPVAELRAVGYEAGLPEDVLRDGNAYELPYDDRAFDVVTAFGVMHHLQAPDRAIREMLRIASPPCSSSDVNNFGAGASRVKVLLRALALARCRQAQDARTRMAVLGGRRSFHSYSLFSSLPLLRGPAMCS